MSSNDPTAPGSGSTSDDTSTEPAPTRRASGFDDEGHLKSSRSGALYIGLIVAAVLSILVLVFIIQNSESTAIKFLGFEWSLPLGVGVLLAVVAGMLIIAVPGSVRIMQLRRSLTKNHKRGHDG
ncbi:lipopolysaccharide assembly LapA domain-containing protein [Aeromicrobium sp. CTD01-1L150]|uniref:LapA family protein n=1 Tax=Aeromicrobium sp. CTD01-1L150 TaxID=3341830 RepID=UPI0035C15525